MAPPRTTEPRRTQVSGLPEGWTAWQHIAQSGRTYMNYRGPHGEIVHQSKTEVLRLTGTPLNALPLLRRAEAVPLKLGGRSYGRPKKAAPATPKTPLDTPLCRTIRRAKEDREEDSVGLYSLGGLRIRAAARATRAARERGGAGLSGSSGKLIIVPEVSGLLAASASSEVAVLTVTEPMAARAAAEVVAQREVISLIARTQQLNSKRQDWNRDTLSAVGGLRGQFAAYSQQLSTAQRAAERRATLEETMRESLALEQIARDRREVVSQRRQAMFDAEQAFKRTKLEAGEAEASVQQGKARLQRRLASMLDGETLALAD